LTPAFNRTPATAASPPPSNDDGPALGTSSTIRKTAGSASKASPDKPTTARPSDEDDPAVTGYGGLDVSDYV
jgi:hypothetical protein